MKKSFSLVASLLSAITIGLMIACIISVVIIAILSFWKKNTLSKLNLDKEGPHVNKAAAAAAEEDEESIALVLEAILLFEGILYCIVNVVILRKWVGLTIFSYINLQPLHALSKIYRNIFKYLLVNGWINYQRI